MQSPSSIRRSSPGHHSNNNVNENEELRKRRQRKRRRRPASSNESLPTGDTNQRSQSSSGRTYDPFHLIAMSVDHDENKKNAFEILQVPLETGKLYHNEDLFCKALTHLRNESRSFRLGWSIPFFSSKPKWTKDLVVNDDEVNENNDNKELPKSPRNSAALTPIILSGLLASLETVNFTTTSELATENGITSTTSTELVNYTVGMRRAALARVRLRIQRERTQRVVKPVLAIVACLGLYSYAWSSLQRLLVGFYGVTNIVLTKNGDNGGYVEHTVDMLRLTTSPCRTRANSDHFGHLSDYTKACRIAEAMTIELLTSQHNSRHTKLFARTAYDEIQGEVVHEREFSEQLQYDDDYGDDTELPLYAMHTSLGDNESSIIPLDDVIHGKRTPKDNVQKQRWKRRRRRQQKYDQEEQQSDDIAALAYASFSNAVQFWGDTTVNHLVREAIVQAHSSNAIDDSNFKLKLLDVGSGMSGTLFSLCTPEFPFQDWSYHGIAISQPEVRRANQLVDTMIRPILDLASGTATSDIVDGDTSDSIKFPISNVTIQRASFDDPLLPKEYTTMVAIESLAFSHNITHTLANLVRSLKPKGTLVVVEDVVAPWAKGSNNVAQLQTVSGKDSLLTHQEWLEIFAEADLTVQKVRDLMLEFDAFGSSTTSAVPLFGDRPWYSIGHGLLKGLIRFGFQDDDDDDDDDGNLSNRALYLMEDMIVNEQGNSLRRAAHGRADLGYYMYICTKN